MSVAPRIAIRVDASADMGTGHLRRCLSLAAALIELGAEVRLLVRRLDQVAAHVLDSAQPAGTSLQWLAEPQASSAAILVGPLHRHWAGVQGAQDAAETVAALHAHRPDWVVVDHYAFDQDWHAQVRRGLGCRLMVIDDLADRDLDADVLLDQNLDRDHRAKYAKVLRCRPRLLAGPRYALLSSVYRDAPRYRHHDTVRSIGIFMGGTDPGSASVRALKACRDAGFIGPVEIMSTSVNPHLSQLRSACAASASTRLSLDAPDLAGFFARHDLHIGAGGGAAWERCCIGVPAIGIVLASNQLAVLPELNRMGVLRAARFDEQVELAELQPLSDVLKDLLRDPDARRWLADNAAALVDGQGARRVALSLLGERLGLRPARMDDTLMLHAWRNAPSVRVVSGTQEPIALADHQRWMSRVLATQDRCLFVAEVGPLAVGCIRFDSLAVNRFEVSLYLDPGLSGLGLGQRLLEAGETAILGRWTEGFSVYARVLPDNAVSRRLFEACGYRGGPEHFSKLVPASHRTPSL